MRKPIILALTVVIAIFSFAALLIFTSAFIDQEIKAGAAPSFESLMKRAWMFLEDEEWKRADEYFDRVLDIGPEHAPAYLGKLCAELKIKDEADLANHAVPLDDMRNYQRALRFADARLSVKLEGYNQAIMSRIKEAGRQIGAVIQFGGYDWRVLDVQDNRALIITKDVIEKRPYNGKSEEVTWETCTLREYLNGEFLQKFTEEEQKRIAETGISNPNNPQNGTDGGNDTNDKIFLLSIEEANRYFSSDSERMAKEADGTASWWWLRSPGYYSYTAARVSVVGYVTVYGLGVFTVDGGVRPALWINVP